MRFRKNFAIFSVITVLLLLQIGIPQRAEAQNLQEILDAAEQGDTHAQFLLGAMYNSGRNVSKDVKKAAQWFEKAAKKGHKDAQYHLGVMYDKGRGVSKKDMKEAVKWYRAAAKQGSVDAQLTLSVLYRSGRGVPKNINEAKKWYDAAASTWQIEDNEGAYLRHE